MNKLTRERVAPIISASISCVILGSIFCGWAAVASEQQKSPDQPFLGGVKELIDQILLDSDIPRKHISHEAVGERMLGFRAIRSFRETERGSRRVGVKRSLNVGIAGSAGDLNTPTALCAYGKDSTPP
jgi:hypothetical protein